MVAGISGVVRIGENEKGERVLTVVGDDEVEEPNVVARRTHLFHAIADGVGVDAGQQLTGDAKTPIDPKRILEVKGAEIALEVDFRRSLPLVHRWLDETGLLPRLPADERSLLAAARLAGQASASRLLLTLAPLGAV